MNNTIPYKWPFYGKMIKADSAQIALKKNKNDKSSCRSIINNKARKRSGSKTDDCYCNVVKVGVNHFLFKTDSQNINLNRLKRTKLHFFLLKSFFYGWQDKVYWNIQSVSAGTKVKLVLPVPFPALSALTGDNHLTECFLSFSFSSSEVTTNNPVRSLDESSDLRREERVHSRLSLLS